MPYKISKNKKSGVYTIKKKSTGKVVAHAKSEKNLKGVLWHRDHGA
jgi:hypothetical protein